MVRNQNIIMENIVLPIACTLTEAELEQRRETMLSKVIAKAEEIHAVQDGYAFRFKPADAILEEIVSLIQKERKCCRFLHFNLRVTPDEGPIWLELAGPVGTKEFLETTLGIRLSSTAICPKNYRRKVPFGVLVLLRLSRYLAVTITHLFHLQDVGKTVESSE